jgi:hypothetical protein
LWPRRQEVDANALTVYIEREGNRAGNWQDSRAMVDEKAKGGEAVVEPDPYENDPLFKQVFDGQWNA